MLQMIAERPSSKRMAFYLEAGGSYHLAASQGDRPPTLQEVDRLLAEGRDRSILLSREFDYVRVDWMTVGDRLYFSELTFTPGAGISTSFGDDLDLRVGPLWVRKGTARRARPGWAPRGLRRS